MPTRMVRQGSAQPLRGMQHVMMSTMQTMAERRWKMMNEGIGALICAVTQN